MAAPSAPGSDERRVVVGIDGSPGSVAALRWAAAEARRLGARIDAVTAWAEVVPTAVGMAPVPVLLDDHGLRERVADEVIAEAFPAARPAGLTRRVVAGSPGAVLSRAALGARLLVVGERSTSGVGGLFFGSTALDVVRHSPCPVAVVPREVGGSDEQARVLVGLDGSAASRTALHWAAGEAARRGATLDVVVCWRAPAPIAPFGEYVPVPPGPPEEWESADQLGRAAVREVEALFGIGVELHVEPGRASDVLAERSARAAMLVVGAPSHHGIAALVVHSTALDLARRPRCPVVVVPAGVAAGVPLRLVPVRR